MDATQAISAPCGYGALVMAEDAEQQGMLHWLARAASEMRDEHDRKLVNIASSLGRSESTVSRFEKAVGWPERPDAMIDAYADDLDINPIEIWSRALELWRAATVATQLEDGPPQGPADLGSRLLVDTAKQQRDAARGRKRDLKDTGSAQDKQQ